jgi:hypothetical protein
MRTKVVMVKPKLQLSWLANDMLERGSRKRGAGAILVAGLELLQLLRPRHPRHFEEMRWTDDSVLVERFLYGQIV